jgi:hypothetical protein
MRLSSLLRSIGLLLMLSLTAACGNGNGGSSSVDPNAPVIANLRANLDVRCNLGRVLTVTLDYVDADGNVLGGTLEATFISFTGARLADSTPITSPPVTIFGNPAPAVAVSGTTTSGTITATSICYGFGSSGTAEFKVVDATAKSSNSLTIAVRAPNIPDR